MSATAPPRVGVVGAGQMGRPMVDRLGAAGFDVTALARRAEVRDELAAAGITAAASATEVAASAGVLIVCLFDDRQVRDVVLDGGVLAAMRAGSVLVNHVTGNPDLAVELAARAPDGVAVVDGPISGTADSIRRGELTVLAGADADVLDRVRPVLAAYADPILHVGPIGDGQRAKLVNNLLFSVNLRAAADAAHLGRSLGLEPTALAAVLMECSGASFAMGLLRHAAPEQLLTSVRRYLTKDVAVIQQVAAASGVELGPLGRHAAWVFED